MEGFTGEQASDPPLYAETQRFRQLWVLAIVGLIAIISWYAFIRQIIQGIPFGNNPAPDPIVAVLLVAFGILVPKLFLVMASRYPGHRHNALVPVFPVSMEMDKSSSCLGNHRKCRCIQATP